MENPTRNGWEAIGAAKGKCLVSDNSVTLSNYLSKAGEYAGAEQHDDYLEPLPSMFTTKRQEDAAPSRLQRADAFEIGATVSNDAPPGTHSSNVSDVFSACLAASLFLFALHFSAGDAFVNKEAFAKSATTEVDELAVASIPRAGPSETVAFFSAPPAIEEEGGQVRSRTLNPLSPAEAEAWSKTVETFGQLVKQTAHVSEVKRAQNKQTLHQLEAWLNDKTR